MGAKLSGGLLNSIKRYRNTNHSTADYARTPFGTVPLEHHLELWANQVKTTVKIAKMSFKSALTRLSTVGARGMLTQRYVLFVWTWPITISFPIPYFSFGYF